MFKKSLFIAITTLILVAASFSPLVSEPVKAQTLFPNCVNGVCTFPKTRTWNSDCEYNLLHTLEVVGKGSNAWLIPVGNTSEISFNTAAGSMDTDMGYRKVPYDDNQNGVIDGNEDMPGRCACDVASMFYITGLANGYEAQPQHVNHYLFPGVIDKQYSVEIYNPGKDMFMPNETGNDIVFYWTIDGGNIVMRMKFGGEIPTPDTNRPIVTPSPNSTHEPGEGSGQSAGQERTEKLVISNATRDIYHQIFVKSEVLKVLIETKAVDEDKLIAWAVWLVRALLLFIFLFVYLVLRGFVNSGSGGGKWIERQAGQKTYKVYVPRSYFNGWYWFLLILFRIILFFNTDYLYRRAGGEIWWILFGLTVFFWFAKRADVSQGRGGRPSSEVSKWLWNWGIGSATFVVAGYVWGATMVLVAYALTGAGGTEKDVPWYRQPVVIPSGGDVVPEVWGPIAQAVKDEGGADQNAALLYALQRSEFAGSGECTESNHQACTSYAGAQGWFQFMPTTWTTYAEPSWNRYDLYDSARAAYRMVKKLRLFDQPDRESFQIRFTGSDGGLAWNLGSRYNHARDGWDQAGEVWDHYQKILKFTGTPRKYEIPILTDTQTSCVDPLEPCGFALPGGPSLYVQGTFANGGKGFHDGAWDWWDLSKASSSVKPIDVLSMLNGVVASLGRYNNGGLGGGTTYLYITNGRWTQRVYHCDSNYISVGDEVKWGQPVCLLGNQGDSDWPHLDLRLDGPNGPVMDQTQFWIAP